MGRAAAERLAVVLAARRVVLVTPAGALVVVVGLCGRLPRRDVAGCRRTALAQAFDELRERVLGTAARNELGGDALGARVDWTIRCARFGRFGRLGRLTGELPV
ncbi:MAG TPA: hypothetical protein VFV94_17055, partial [Polyangiaceae bacterium]|nr:hypothetical protein [Polyangiaceae bacterium]